MTAAGFRDLGILLFTLFVMSIPAAYLWWNMGRRPLSPLRLRLWCLAWSVLFCFPCGMAYGCLDAWWPYEDGHYASMHKFRWDLLARDGAVGLLVAFLLGTLFGSLVARQQGSAQASRFDGLDASRCRATLVRPARHSTTLERGSTPSRRLIRRCSN